MPIQSNHGGSDRLERWSGLAIAIILHAAAIWGLLQVGAVRQAIVGAAPIMVNFITLPPQPAQYTAPPQEPERPPVTPESQPSPPKVATEPPPKPKPPVKPRKSPPPPPPRAPEPPPAVAAPSLPVAAPIEAAPPPAPAPVIPPSVGAAYLNNPKPAYPALSKRLREEGKVLLHVLIDAQGAAAQVELQESSGFSRLDQAAMEAVRSWRFVPAQQAGKAVSAWVTIPISFSLKG